MAKRKDRRNSGRKSYSYFEDKDYPITFVEWDDWDDYRDSMRGGTDRCLIRSKNHPFADDERWEIKK